MNKQRKMPDGEKARGRPKKPVKRPLSAEEEPKQETVPKKRKTFKAEAEALLSGKPGVLLAFGMNETGQLGLGEDIQEKIRAALIEIPSPVIDIAAGAMHSLCLTETGEIYSFGCNDDGALGRDTSVDGSECVPGLVTIKDDSENIIKIVKMSAGDSHSTALSENGDVYVWGDFRNNQGSYGLTTKGKVNTPLLILKGSHVIDIKSGDNHIICLTNKNEVLSWGPAEQGQLGRISKNISASGPRNKNELLLPKKINAFPIKRQNTIAKIFTGSSASLVASLDGNIYGCGLNNYIQLGNIPNMPSEELCIYYPALLPTFKDVNWVSISGGSHHTLALSSEGQVYSLGRKEYGRLGLGEHCEDQTAPALITELKDIVCTGISAGETNSFAVSKEGNLYSWGGSDPNLGLGNLDDDVTVPTHVKGKTINDYHIVKVAAGSQHTLALGYLKSNGESS